MPYDNTPNRLEAAFVQRDKTNQYYEQVNISGSNLVIYIDETGSLTADRVSVWAAKYGIGSGGSSLSSSWASSSISASYAGTASYLIGGAGNSMSSSWASASLQAQYATQSLYATQSISASHALTASYLIGGAGNSESSSWASASLQAQYATQSLFASQSISASYALTSSYTLFASEAFTADTVNVIAVGGGPYNIALLGSNGGVVNVYADNNGDFLYSVADKTLIVGHAQTTASWATQSISASYVSANNVVGTVLSASYALTASYALIARASASITASSADTASTVYNSNVTIDLTGNASFTNVVSIGGSLGAGKFLLTQPGFNTITMQSGSITASYFGGYLVGRADQAVSASWASASISASYARTASYSFTSVSSSIATTASYITASSIVGYVSTASIAITASNACSASYATTASFALLAGEATTADFAVVAGNTLYTSSNAITASYAINVPSASWSETASYSMNESAVADYIGNQVFS